MPGNVPGAFIWWQRQSGSGDERLCFLYSKMSIIYFDLVYAYDTIIREFPRQKKVSSERGDFRTGRNGRMKSVMIIRGILK